MERADKYSMYISDKTGLAGIVNPEKGIYCDFGAQSTKLKIEDKKVLEYNAVMSIPRFLKLNFHMLVNYF